MTDHDSIALARRLVACPKFRLLDGMLVRGPAGRRARIVDINDQLYIVADGGLRTASSVAPSFLVPDLSDAATLGCLLQLVREAWGDPTLTPDFISIGSPQNDKGFPHWFCWVEWPNNDPSSGVSRTEAGALVAALEAAPE